MKLLSQVILLLFLTFLAAPTVVGFVNSSCGKELKVNYNLAEEENIKEIKTAHPYIISDYSYPIFEQAKNSSKIPEGAAVKHDNVFDEIFSPPPELS